MEQPKKKVLLTAKRVNEVADSLDKESYNKSVGARFAEKTGYPSIAKEEYERSDIDKKNAARYRKLAEAAKRAKINI
jgi:hypothetical protein